LGVAVELEALKHLEPAKMDAGARPTCLPGTRVDILNNLFDSLTDPSLPSGRNIIWLCAPAGAGKSTILTTVAQHFLAMRRQGAFLFWDRNDSLNGDPLRVIRTLAFQLARFNSIFRTKLAARIETNPNIITSDLDTQFRHLLEEPLAELAAEVDLGPIVIILDAPR
jgi:ATP/maltotriose-dependent transcriptional regulator MalT